MPDRTHVVDMGKVSPLLGKYVATLNQNQAIYVLSQQQIQDMEYRCGFLTDIGQNPFYRSLRKAMDEDWRYVLTHSAAASACLSSIVSLSSISAFCLSLAQLFYSYRRMHARMYDTGLTIIPFPPSLPLPLPLPLPLRYISVGVSEWSSSFQQVLQCGLRRLTPVGEGDDGGDTNGGADSADGAGSSSSSSLHHQQQQQQVRNNNKWANFFIHHSVNKAQTRRLRKELLTQRDWEEVVRRKSASPITLEAYSRLVWEQYNLKGVDGSRLEAMGRTSKWDWDLPSPLV
jgi:hypothetical protein